jgi:hypothetical protein
MHTFTMIKWVGIARTIVRIPIVQEKHCTTMYCSSCKKQIYMCHLKEEGRGCDFFNHLSFHRSHKQQSSLDIL